MQKIWGIVLLCMGFTLIGGGLMHYRQATVPDACVVGFVRSLGGEYSFAFEKERQKKKAYALAVVSGGTLLLISGGLCVFRSGRNRKDK
jgi:hypothetical protein